MVIKQALLAPIWTRIGLSYVVVAENPIMTFPGTSSEQKRKKQAKLFSSRIIKIMKQKRKKQDIRK